MELLKELLVWDGVHLRRLSMLPKNGGLKKYRLENLGFKGFKKKGIEPGLNELMWQMFGDIVVTGEHA
ncbi:hypothetical protein Gotur_029755 [Gossypium turneri]